MRTNDRNVCGRCGGHARNPKSPARELQRRACPRYPTGSVHRGCCALEACSEKDARGHVRCAWARGGRERVLAG
ncbi:MAG TPA: hypothetical protein VM889_14570 [Candidatus Thermoplasmatota archaeon]|nr:hypothetical protein [Candidatus Thermoplasmatota archaeon]